MAEQTQTLFDDNELYERMLSELQKQQYFNNKKQQELLVFIHSIDHKIHQASLVLEQNDNNEL